MKNFIAEGETIEVIAPSSVTTGQLVKVGTIFGVAKHSAASGNPVQLQREGVFSLPKAAGLVLAQGDIALWDGTKVVASGGDVIGSVTQAATGGASTASVLLSGDVQEFTGSQRAALAAVVSGAGNLATSRAALASDNGATLELANGITYTLTDAVALPAGVVLMGPASGSATIAVTGTATINGGTSSVTVAAGSVYSAIPRATSAVAFVVKGS